MIKLLFALIGFLTIAYSNMFSQSIENRYVLEGFILYPSTDTIPQDVIIVPHKFEELNDEVIGYWIYFQSIRWTQQNLLETLKKADTYEVMIENIVNPKVGFIGPGIVRSIAKPGKIIFDSSYSKQIEAIPSEEIFSVRILIKNKYYTLRYQEAPREFGLPKSFEIVDVGSK